MSISSENELSINVRDSIARFKQILEEFLLRSEQAIEQGMLIDRGAQIKNPNGFSNGYSSRLSVQTWRQNLSRVESHEKSSESHKENPLQGNCDVASPFSSLRR